MNVLELAADAGMLVVLDGRIGGTEYRSIHGTMEAFDRFVHALESAWIDRKTLDPAELRRNVCAKSSP